MQKLWFDKLSFSYLTSAKEHNARHHPPRRTAELRQASRLKAALFAVGWMPLLGAAFPRPHLSASRVCFQDGFMQRINRTYDLTILINLHQPPRNMLHLRLQLAGIAQHIAQSEQQIVLHDANHVGNILRVCALSQKILESLTDAGARLAGVLVGIINLSLNPRTIVVGDYLTPGLPKKQEPAELVNAFERLRGCPSVVVSRR